MRSKGCPKDPIRERLAEARWGLRYDLLKKAPRYVRLGVHDGKARRVYQSLHRTPEARRWRTVLRLRKSRAKPVGIAPVTFILAH